MNTNSLLRLQVRIQSAFAGFRESEKGQTMVEYAGMAIVVGAILAVVLKAVGTNDLGDVILRKIKAGMNKVGGGFPF